MKKMLCAKDIATFENEIIVEMPKHWKTKKQSRRFGIDPCISAEIVGLISEGIRTHWTCCGHGFSEGIIAVEKKDYKKMRKMGYKEWKLKADPSQVYFIPKSKCRRAK